MEDKSEEKMGNTDKAEQLQAILDNANLNVLVCDAQLRIVYANKGIINFSARDGAPYVGRTCYDYMIHRDAPCKNCNICRLGQENLFVDEFGIKDKWYRRHGQRINWAGRDAFVEYIEDITADKKNQFYEISPSRPYNFAIHLITSYFHYTAKPHQ
jgi:PAS fold.